MFVLFEVEAETRRNKSFCNNAAGRTTSRAETGFADFAVHECVKSTTPEKPPGCTLSERRCANRNKARASAYPITSVCAFMTSLLRIRFRLRPLFISMQAARQRVPLLHAGRYTRLSRD